MSDWWMITLVPADDTTPTVAVEQHEPMCEAKTRREALEMYLKEHSELLVRKNLAVSRVEHQDEWADRMAEEDEKLGLEPSEGHLRFVSEGM